MEWISVKWDCMIYVSESAMFRKKEYCFPEQLIPISVMEKKMQQKKRSIVQPRLHRHRNLSGKKKKE